MSRTLFLIPLFILLTFSANGQNFHAPSEILKIMEASELSYELEMTEEDLVEESEGEVLAEGIYQVGEGTNIRIKDYEVDERFVEQWKLVVGAINAEEYVVALELLKTLNDQYPDFSFVMAYAGMVEEKMGRDEAAERWLKRALEQNFMDYNAHWFLAELYAKQKRKEEAAVEISLAHVLNPHHEGLSGRMQKIFKSSRRKWDDAPFEPNYTLDRNGSTVSISFSEEWMMYAFCKAVWAFEPGYARRMGGRMAFNMNEEMECLLNLLSGAERTEGKRLGGNKGFQRLKRAIEAQMLAEFVMYELWMAHEPLVAYTQPKSVVEKLAEYVREVRVK